MAGRKRKSSDPPTARVKLTGNWKTLMKEALEKKKPAGGWPGHETKPEVKRK